MHSIAEQRGELSLFALVMRADALGKYDLVAAAPWLESGTLKATSELVELLSDSIGDQGLRQLARVSALSDDHPLVRFLIENYSVEDGELHISTLHLGPFHVEHAIVLRAAKRPAEVKGRHATARAAASRR